jgi:hypothetical protein
MVFFFPIRMPDAESPIQAGIAGGNRGPPAIAEIQGPAFPLLFPGRRTPLPTGELDGGFNAKSALAIGASYQALKIIDGRERPILETRLCQVSAVPLRLNPTEARTVIGSRPHQVRIGIDPILRLAGALTRRSP